jgi:hypothetical protein
VTGTPLSSSYRADGSLYAVHLDYEAMSSQERDDIIAWIKAHRINPGLVPIDVEIGFDPLTEEWRFPVHVRGPQGHGIRINKATREPLMRIVRRQRQPVAFPIRPAEVDRDHGRN